MLKRTFNQHSPHDFVIMEDNGAYRNVSDEEVIETALSIINERFVKGTSVIKSQDAYDFLKLELGAIEHEVFAVIWLDNQHCVIEFEELFRGTIDGASVYPREVVKSALKYNAAACILCHNHPSGLAEPSQADKNITVKLKAALDLIEVRTLDHVIIAGNNYSFAEQIMLKFSVEAFTAPVEPLSLISGCPLVS